MRVVIAVALVLVGVASAAAQSTTIDTGPATSTTVTLPPDRQTQTAQQPPQSTHVAPQAAQSPATAKQQNSATLIDPHSLRSSPAHAAIQPSRLEQLISIAVRLTRSVLGGFHASESRLSRHHGR